MLTRIILCLSLMGAATTLLPGQQLEWVFIEPGDGCSIEQSDCNSNEQCYGLVYTPAFTGTVTSYTMGFFANCIDGTTSNLRGQSCTMVDNTDIMSACAQAGILQLLPSGNTGGLAVSTGVPVKLHEVCINLPPGRSMTFSEDASLALTVSINLPNNSGAVTDILDYTNFTASSSDCSGSLPVTWEAFTVRQAGKNAYLNWITAEESGHDYFEVEWATDGQNFSPLASVREADQRLGSGGSYHYYHETPAPGVNYYRIRQVDLTGEFSYSTIESLTFQEADIEETFRLFPNPAHDQVQMVLPANQETTDIQLYSMAGQLLITKPVNNQQLVSLDIQRLPAGCYLIRAGKETKRLIKK